MRVLITSRSYVDTSSGLHEQLDILAEKVDLYVMMPKEYKRELKEYIVNESEFLNKKYKVFLMDLIFLKRDSALFYYKNMKAVLDKIKPDIIHIEEEPWTLFNYLLIKYSKQYNSKIIIFSWENIYQEFRFPLNYFEKYSIKNADYYLPGNEDAMEILIKKGWNKGVKVIPRYGINLNSFVRDESLRGKWNGFVIGFVGRLIHDKGLKYLFEAIRDFMDYTLVVIGGGPQEEEMRLLSKNLNVVFIKTINYKEMNRYISAFDVLVLPSITMPRWKEQFGHVLIEAMACGVPVIGSDSGEIPRVIGNAGLIFKEKDLFELKGCLLTLKNNSELYNRLVKSGHQRVKEFSCDNIVGCFYDVYTNLV
ncbi:glycosyltransferase family 4 protein [Candidatus Woesearchaeota archaeon]|nr:glycosyltransferase family 4 protein [Candidatus Woesearchaeota archaeon]